MPTLNYSVAISGLGGSISRNIPRTEDGGGSNEIAVGVGYSGTLTTRTDDETGSLTLASGHGITTAQVIDLYWSGGARYGITVGTVATNVVPIGADNSGTGDVLPTAATAIVASPRVTFNCAIDGDELALLGVQQAYASNTEAANSHISFLDSGSAEIEEFALSANVPRTFDITGGDTNGFTGNPITSAVVSNGSATNAATLKILWVQDST